MIDLHQSAPPDLGWLIHNPQVTDEALGAALLGGYRPGLELLASAILPSPAETIRLVDSTLVWIILNRQNYRSEGSGRAWLYSRFLQECAAALSTRDSPGASTPARPLDLQPVIQAFDPGSVSPQSHFAELLQTLEKRAALLLILHYGCGLTQDEIAFALRLPGEQVKAGFAEFRRELEEHQRTCPVCTSATGSLLMLETLLRKALTAAGPVFDLSASRLAHWNASIQKQVTRRQEKLRARTQMAQLLQASLGVLALLLAGWLAIQAAPRRPASFPPARAAARQPTQDPIPILAGPTPAALTPIPNLLSHPEISGTPAVLAVPDTASLPDVQDTSGLPDVSVILNLMDRSQDTWHSLWADVQITHYNTAENTSLPQPSTRAQAWVSQPSLNRVIIGPIGGLPFATYSIANGSLTGQNFADGQLYERSITSAPPDADLQALFFPTRDFYSRGTFTLLKKDSLALRPVWVLDWISPGNHAYRLWIDADYGVILRRREYSAGDLRLLLADIQVRSIFFDVPFAPAIFQVSQYKGDHFATDFTGAPEVPDPQSVLSAAAGPPEALRSTPDPTTGAGSAPASAGKAVLSCQRSPDGRQVAYTSAASGPAGNTSLSLARLSPVQPARPVLPGGFTSGDFAFSPDGRKLAFFGCDKASGFCGAFSLDTSTGMLNRLIALSYADYIFWSPSGQYLALVGSEDTFPILNQKSGSNLLMNEVSALGQNWHFFVIQASSGEVIYKRTFDWSHLTAPTDSPTNAWGAPFKVRPDTPPACPSPLAKIK